MTANLYHIAAALELYGVGASVILRDGSQHTVSACYLMDSKYLLDDPISVGQGASWSGCPWYSLSEGFPDLHSPCGLYSDREQKNLDIVKVSPAVDVTL